jgi:hypothetical protein
MMEDVISSVLDGHKSCRGGAACTCGWSGKWFTDHQAEKVMGELRRVYTHPEVDKVLVGRREMETLLRLTGGQRTTKWMPSDIAQGNLEDDLDAGVLLAPEHVCAACGETTRERMAGHTKE